MRLAYQHRFETIDKRGLALSIAFHLLLLLLFILSRHGSSEIAAPPVAVPPLTLDLSLAPDEPRAELQKSESADKSAPREQPVKTPAALAVADAPHVAAPPLTETAVPPLVQLPTFALTDSSAASVAGSSSRAGTAGDAIGSATSGNGSGSGAGGGGGGAGDGAITAERPDWIVQPTANERLAVLSPQARDDEASGWAVLSCMVTRLNRVRGCRVIRESTDAKGKHSYAFGNSALRLSTWFRIRPPMRNGQPRYDIPVRIPVYWTWK